jgi:hypothetical protein
MAIAVAAGRQGIDAIDPVAGPDKPVDDQAAIDLMPTITSAGSWV